MAEHSIVLVDDHPPLRAGVAAIIGRSGRYRVVAESGSIEEALRLIRQHRPDIVVADISLPDGSGIDLTRLITRDSLAEHVLILTMHARRALAETAFVAGAGAYVLKDSTAEHLIAALDAVRSGERYLDAALQSVEPERRTGELSLLPGDGGELTQLSEREFEVFRLLATGQNSKQIGVRLGISHKTVDNHRASVMEKLALESIADLVRLAIRTGTIDP